MRKSVLVLCCAVGLALSLALLWAGGRARANGYSAEETPLNPSGEAYELNVDGEGNLWASDFGAEEIWQIHPATGVYTTYAGLSSPSDARSDASGHVWWSDTDDELWRLALGSGIVTSWTLPAGGALLGTAVDGAGNVWVTDSTQPLLHRFAPGTTELCSYDVPDGGTSNYIATDGSDVWLSDYTMSRILRLAPASDEFTMWDLPWTSFVNGIAIDGEGDIWVAESAGYSLLAQLEPEVSQLTAYTLPVGIWSEMVTLQGGLVWYSEDHAGTVGVLDPAAADGVTHALFVSSEQVTPSCSILGPGSSAAVVTRTGTVTWTTSALTAAVESQGWTVYSLPASSAPWGIAIVDGDVFVVDRGRQMLVRISSVGWEVYLPMVVRQGS
jgi:streptogramin lyase